MNIMNVLTLMCMALLVNVLHCDPIKQIICENQKMNLKCYDGFMIKINSANYGRSDSSTCPNPLSRRNNKYCSSGSSLPLVKQSCEGKQTCAVMASDSVFGDPCFGTFKYLNVTYECVETYEQTICESHHINTLSCKNGRVIKIVKANYGRSDFKTCLHPRIQTDKCNLTTAMATVQKHCDGKDTCSFPVSNSFFRSDPCRWTKKYLSLSYRCEAKPTTCQNQLLKLECGNNHRIRITSANYGRSDKHTCVPQNARPHPDKCTAEGALAIVQKICNNREKCVVKADRMNFGDPCPGFYSYLDVSHTCEPNELEVSKCEGGTLNINCNDGHVIAVRSADYGRTDLTTCPHQNITSTTCTDERTVSRVSRVCGGKQKCALRVSDNLLGNPCPGTHKYLNMVYQCLREKDLEEDTKCDGQTFNIKCNEGYVIDIAHAAYGYGNIKGCTKSTSYYSPCVHAASLPRVTQLCEGRQSCSLPVNHATFSRTYHHDPYCYIGGNYLTIKHRCVPKIGMIENTVIIN